MPEPPRPPQGPEPSPTKASAGPGALTDVFFPPPGTDTQPPTLPAERVPPPPDGLPSPPPERPAHVPAVAGYEVLGELGRGGMGVVYKARQLGLGRTVALKMILAGSHAGPAERARFLREAAAIASLQHPNIVQVHEVGEADGCPFFSLEFVEGQSLAQKYAGAPQPPRHAARLVETLARTIHHAHAKGVVHRDLKPSNVLLTPDGAPKVTDFGLAKYLDGEAAAWSPAGATRTGAVMGTPGYMAPEQAQGRSKQVGPAADVYSLGAILYELLTGRPPFQAATAVDTILLVLEREPVPPSRLVRTIPRDLETVCLKCLQKDPARRYPSAEALADDLDAFLRDQPVRARRTGKLERAWRWCRRNRAVAGLAASVALLLLLLTAGALASAAWMHGRRREALDNLDRAVKAEAGARENEERARERLWESLLAQARAGRFSGRPGRRFEGLDAVAKAAAIRPSLDLRNEAIACMALADVRAAPRLPGAGDAPGAWGWNYSADRGTLTLTDPSGKDKPVSLPGTHGKVQETYISPDGKYLALLHSGRAPNALVVWDWRARRKLAEVSGAVGSPVGWSPDGREFFCGHPDGTVDVHALPQGKKVRTLRAGKSLPCQCCAVSPDGRVLALGFFKPAGLTLVDYRTGERKADWALPLGVYTLAWGADSQLVATGCSDRRVYVWDALNRRQAGVIPDADGHNAVAFSPSGHLLAACGWAGLTRLADPATGKVLVQINGAFSGPFLGQERPGGPASSLWLPRAGGTPHGFFEVAPASECRPLRDAGRDFSSAVGFSPDGRLLALSDDVGVHLVDVAFGREVAVLPLGLTAGVAFHPDGSLLTYNAGTGLLRWPVRRGRDDPAALRVGPPQDLKVRPVYHGHYNWLAVGRDGRIAVTDWGARRAVLLRPDRPARQVELAPHNGARSVALGPGGRYVATGTWKGDRVCVWDARTGRRVKEFPAPGEASHVAFSPDGRWLVVSQYGEYVFREVGTWKEGLVLKRKESWLPGMLAFSPDGRTLALCDTPRRVKLVRADGGEELATLDAPEEKGVMGLGFSPDGGHLAVATGSGTWLWDLRRVRRQLADLRLDWDLPAPPAPAWAGGAPLKVSVDLGKSGGGAFVPPAVVTLPPRRPREAKPGEIAGWVRALEEGDADERARAERSLVEVGAPAREALAEASRHAGAGGRARIAEVLERIARAEALAPRRVRLKLRGVSVPEAVQALAGHTGVELHYTTSRPAGASTPLNLELDGVPFWEALDRLCQSAGLVWTYRPDRRGIQLSGGKPPPAHLLDYPGPYRLGVLGLSTQHTVGLGTGQPSRSRRLALGLGVFPEVGSTLLAVGPPTLTRADDDTGSSLLGGPQPRQNWVRLLRGTNQSQSMAFTAWVRPPGGKARKITRLEGTLPVDLMVDLKRLARVEDVRNAEGKSFKGPGKLVLKVLRVRQENRFLAVQVRLEGFDGKYDPARHRWQARDSVGRPLRIYPYPPNFFESEEGWTGTVAVEAPEGAGPGTTLTLSQFRPVRTSVPFSFRDVPLP